MGWLQRIFGGEKRARESENFDWAASFRTRAGVHVDADSALSFPAVLQAVRIISEGVAQLPLITYKRGTDSREREVARDHPLYTVLHFQPNPEMTPFEFKEIQQVDRLLRGTSYAEIVRAGNGQVKELWHLPARYVKPVTRNGKTFYSVTEPGTGKAYGLPADKVLRTRGFSVDGLFGLDVIDRTKESIGYGMALNEYGSAFFNNAATPSGSIVLPDGKTLSEPATKRLKAEIEDAYSGLRNAHRIMLLQDGATFQKIGVTPQEAQYLEARRFSVLEVARIFNIPPHRLMDLERATFSNIEAQGEEFVRYTLGPWLQRIVEPMNIALPLPGERGTVFVEFLAEALLRPDTKARYEAYHFALTDGWITRNEVRQRENLPPIEGLDDPLVPANMLPNGQEPEPEPEPQAREARSTETRARRSVEDRRKVRERFRGLFIDAANRAVRAEVREVKKFIEGWRFNRADVLFNDELTRLYEAIPDRYKEHLGPIILAMSDELAEIALATQGQPMTPALRAAIKEKVDSMVAAIAQTMAKLHREELLAIANSPDGDTAEKLLERLAEYIETAGEALYVHESNSVSEGIVRFVWEQTGETLFKWITVGENCPICTHLDGKIVGYEQHFVAKGDSVQDAEGKELIKFKRKVYHPPAHPGCDCAVIPV